MCIRDRNLALAIFDAGGLDARGGAGFDARRVVELAALLHDVCDHKYVDAATAPGAAAVARRDAFLAALRLFACCWFLYCCHVTRRTFKAKRAFFLKLTVTGAAWLAALKGDSRWSQGLWLGKVEASDEHIVGQGARVYKTRTVRRQPEDKRWSLEAVDALRALPWGEAGQVTDAARTTKRRYITRAVVDLHGATEGCRGCAGTAKRHSTRCATRFDEIFAKQDEDRAARFPQAPAESAAEPREAEAEAKAAAEAAEEAPAPEPQAAATEADPPAAEAEAAADLRGAQPRGEAREASEAELGEGPLAKRRLTGPLKRAIAASGEEDLGGPESARLRTLPGQDAGRTRLA